MAKIGCLSCVTGCLAGSEKPSLKKGENPNFGALRVPTRYPRPICDVLAKKIRYQSLQENTTLN
jgi:hypothetical protein